MTEASLQDPPETGPTAGAQALPSGSGDQHFTGRRPGLATARAGDQPHSPTPKCSHPCCHQTGLQPARALPRAEELSVDGEQRGTRPWCSICSAGRQAGPQDCVPDGSHAPVVDLLPPPGSGRNLNVLQVPLLQTGTGSEGRVREATIGVSLTSVFPSRSSINKHILG